MYRSIITLLFSLSCIIIVAQPKYEVRAAWLTTIYGLDWPSKRVNSPRDIKRQQAELCDILDKLQEANFNTILFQTRLRSDVIYPSRIEPLSAVLTGQTGKSPGYDPLEFAIQECHKRGMEIHAWIVAIPLGTSGHIKRLGDKSVVRSKPQICKQYQGEWFLDPGHPATKDYLSSIAKEITTNYDIDGIHLDYIRYPDRPTNFPDKETYNKYGKGKNIAEWRRDNVTAIVTQIYQDVKNIKPWVKVSSSPLGKFRDTSRYSSRGWNAYHTVYQDAQGWLQQGIQDMVFPMLYFDNNQFYPFVLDWQENSYGRPVVPGLGIYFLHHSEKDWPVEAIERQLNFIRQQGLGGEAFYRTKFITDNTKGIYDKLYRRYEYPALPPPMSSMNTELPSPPRYAQLEDNIKDGKLIFSWDKPKHATSTEVKYILYGSDNYPIDISDPSNIITTNIKGTEYIYSYVYPWERKEYYAITTIDRYGNESEPDGFAFSYSSSLYVVLLVKNHFYIPHYPLATHITFLDITGRHVSTIDFQERVSIEHLEDGYYKLLVTDISGKVTSAGQVYKVAKSK